MKAGKIWGTTEALFNMNNVEVHRISINAGGYCSQHRHAHKWNAFYVEKGELRIEVWSTLGGICDVTTLQAGDMLNVRPGDYHRFMALTDVEALEIYWVSLNAEDIIREDVGGRDEHIANAAKLKEPA